MIRSTAGSVLFLLAMMLLQVVVLDNVDIDGYIVPYAYALGVLFLVFRVSRGVFMAAAFVVGAVIDMFQHTGGLNAMACTLMAYLSEPLTRMFFGIPEKDSLIGFDPMDTKNSRISGLALLFALLFIHHVVLYFFETLKFSALPSVLWHALLNALVTFAVCVVTVSLISIKNVQRRRF